jgi:hypothetical protein
MLMYCKIIRNTEHVFQNGRQNNKFKIKSARGCACLFSEEHQLSSKRTSEQRQLYLTGRTFNTYQFLNRCRHDFDQSESAEMCVQKLLTRVFSTKTLFYFIQGVSLCVIL